MKPDHGGLRLIEEERVHRLAHIRAEFRPGIRLREDVMREAFGNKASIRFLRDGEHDFHG